MRRLLQRSVLRLWARPASPRRPRALRPAVEQLEGRRLPATSFLALTTPLFLPQEGAVPAETPARSRDVGPADGRIDEESRFRAEFQLTSTRPAAQSARSPPEFFASVDSRDDPGGATLSIGGTFSMPPLPSIDHRSGP